MNYRRINNIVGWVTGGIALLVYLMTMEPTVSFWDCGEFLSCAYKLEVGHSPGAPFFMLMQRIFGLFAGGAAATGGPSVSDLNQVGAATMINAMSAVMSALSILFLFWMITYFARKILILANAEPDNNQTALIMGAGVVGALACTFSDTFWFSAVEAEVYATSSFFTAITFWAILKWERVADNKHADRWLLLIAYLIGLSVCVHLLNLLTIPAVAMVYYFRRYEFTTKGTILAFIMGCVVLAFVQFGVIQYIPRIASYFDRTFTNSFGASFDTGAMVFFVVLAALLIGLLLLAKKRGMHLLHTSVLCVMFIIIGYSSYFTAIVRSRADVPIDMTNPDNPMSFLDYVNREQFGQQPLLFGPYYNSNWTDLDTSGRMYAPTKTASGKDYYEVVGKKITPIYGRDNNGEDQSHFFPRIWDNNDQNHVNFYKNFLGIGEEPPTTFHNFQFFFGYQMNWMWWRFFMWNFAGRQNDYEGQVDPKNGNWISGISFIDKWRGLGDTDKMTAGFGDSHAHNKLYFLPLILGILGLIYQFNRDKKDGIIVLTLFFFTGAAIGIYLNMPPLQPRERDYAFAGCTYTFTIWIGLGVLMVHDLLRKAIKGAAAVYGAIVLCLVAVPVLMANVEWKDHDRSKKTLARAVAYNTLSCVAPNAVLFTFGDNQTYPLWYIQEIEGFRRDVRIINTSLLGIDWYVDQLNYRVNDADAVPMIWKRKDYIGDRHNYVSYVKNPQIPEDRYFNLADICKFMVSDDPANMGQGRGEPMNYMPTKNFFTASLSKEELIARGWIKPEDTGRIVTDVKWVYPKQMPYKSDLAILNIIAAVANEGWKRPLYFDAGLRSGDYGGTGDYLHMEGVVYRLMPFRYGDAPKINQQVLGTINTEKSYDLFMNTFKWGGAERTDVYFDEPNRHEFVTYRMDASFIANQLIAEGKKDKAIQLLDKVMTNITEKSYCYDYTAYFVAASYYRAGAVDKANKLADKIIKNAETDVAWAATLKDDSRQWMESDVKQDFQIMQSLASTAYQAGDSVKAKDIFARMQILGRSVDDLLREPERPAGGGAEQ
ncbi:MAG: rane protein [Flavipsychrobacter sp.]|jgi:tetratricopeptide (TPR) repeat protein|nr:rane protein [Flavipsychrobacter sp.]